MGLGCHSDYRGGGGHQNTKPATQAMYEEREARTNLALQSRPPTVSIDISERH